MDPLKNTVLELCTTSLFRVNICAKYRSCKSLVRPIRKNIQYVKNKTNNNKKYTESDASKGRVTSHVFSCVAQQRALCLMWMCYITRVVLRHTYFPWDLSDLIIMNRK
jgi:hypothetical protein